MWDSHKATLKALYIDENRSLKEIMEIMKSEHGFEASSVLIRRLPETL